MIDIQQLIADAWAQASTNEFFSGGFLLGALAVIGNYLRKIPTAIWDRVSRWLKFVVYLDNTSPLYEAFSEWYYDKNPTGFKRVEAKFKKEHKKNNVTFLLKLRQYTDVNFMWFNRRMITINKDKVVIEGARDQTSRHIETYNISAFFGRKVITEMMKEVETWWNDKHAGEAGLRCVITDSWANNRVKYVTAYKKLENIYIDGKQNLIDDINNFMSKKDLYKEVGIRFKRGYLLYGKPGTGKSTLVYGVADWLDMPIYYLNPSGFSSDDSFEDFISEVEPWSIILIEDVDVFWTNREDGSSGTKISFQSLLNVLDGLHSPDDVLIFMTTNKPESFDEAFIRKGRLDFKLSVDHPSKEMVEAFIGNFYKKKCVIDKYTGGIPMVDIQDICIKSEGFDETIKQLNNLN